MFLSFSKYFEIDISVYQNGNLNLNGSFTALNVGLLGELPSGCMPPSKGSDNLKKLLVQHRVLFFNF